MEKELSILQNIKQVSPPADLSDKIWREVLSQRAENISWYKVAVAACFLGGLLFSGIYATSSSKANESDQLLDAYNLSNSYNLYHE